MEFNGVREAIYWYFNESDKSPVPTITATIIAFGKLFSVGKGGRLPFKRKRLTAPLQCQNCGQEVQAGGMCYTHLNYLKDYCHTCTISAIEAHKKFIKGGNEFEANRDGEDTIIAKADMGNIVSKLKYIEREVAYLVSQTAAKNWQSIYRALRRHEFIIVGNVSDLTLQRKIHAVLAKIENIIKDAGYIDGPGDYGTFFAHRAN